MSAKSKRAVGAQALRLGAMTAAVVVAWTLVAAPETAAAGEPLVAQAQPEAVTTQSDAQVDAEGPANLTVEVQLTVNDGPLIDPLDVVDVRAGDALAYTYRVTNTGEAVVSSPVVTTADFTGSGELGAMFCQALPRALAPETGFACGRTYVVSEDDATSGDLVHTVVASGMLAGGDVVSSQASVGAQVLSRDGGAAWTYLVPIAALTAALLAVAWYLRRRGASRAQPQLIVAVREEVP